jgi:hypothetical protein
MAYILDAVSPHLQHLSLKSAIDLYRWKDYHPNDHETLDLSIINLGLSLPSLTTLHIYNRSVLFPQTIILLSNAASNLLDLSINIDHPVVPAWTDEHLPPFPPTVIPTKLRSLKMSIGDFGDINEVIHFSSIVELLKRSPCLDQLDFEIDMCAMTLWDLLPEVLDGHL